MIGEKLPLLRFLRPGKLLGGLRRRGVRGAFWHALRKAGTLRGRALTGPYLLRINPMGALCNHACPMCWRQHHDPADLKARHALDRSGVMRLEDYRRLFSAMPPGLEEVTLTGGGEPLLHPDALAIMAEIKQRGWRGYLITNATLLNEAAARRLVAMRWDAVRVSAHCGDRELFKKIHGVDRFEELKRNLTTYTRLRREAGVAGRCRLTLFNVIQRESIAGIAGMFAFAEEVGADEIVFDKVIAYAPADELTPQELREAARRIEAGAAASRVAGNYAEILGKLAVEEEVKCRAAAAPFRPAARCSVGFDEAYVSAAGEVIPCCLSYEVLGDLRTQDFRQIWFGEKYAAFRKRLIEGQFADYCIRLRCAMKHVLHG